MHNNIFQLSSSPINADDFITEKSFELSDIHDYADYVQEYDGDLSEAYSEFPFIATMFVRNGDKLIFKWCRDILSVWRTAIRREMEKLCDGGPEHMEDTYDAVQLLTEPFTHDRFYMGDGYYPLNSSEFLQYCANNLKEGDTLYLGGVLDFHW